MFCERANLLEWTMGNERATPCESTNETKRADPTDSTMCHELSQRN